MLVCCLVLGCCLRARSPAHEAGLLWCQKAGGSNKTSWSAGGGGWVRVLCQAAAGDHLLGAQLLRGVRQRRRHDERRRDSHVLLPGGSYLSTLAMPQQSAYLQALWLHSMQSACQAGSRQAACMQACRILFPFLPASATTASTWCPLAIICLPQLHGLQKLRGLLAAADLEARREEAEVCLLLRGRRGSCCRRCPPCSHTSPWDGWGAGGGQLERAQFPHLAVLAHCCETPARWAWAARQPAAAGGAGWWLPQSQRLSCSWLRCGRLDAACVL